MFRSIFSILSLFFVLAGCHVTRVNRTYVVGQPGRVYKTTDGEVAYTIINNIKGAWLDVGVGATVVYQDMPTGVRQTVGIDCGRGWLSHINIRVNGRSIRQAQRSEVLFVTAHSDSAGGEPMGVAEKTLNSICGDNQRIVHGVWRIDGNTIRAPQEIRRREDDGGW